MTVSVSVLITSPPSFMSHIIPIVGANVPLMREIYSPLPCIRRNILFSELCEEVHSLTGVVLCPYFVLRKCGFCLPNGSSRDTYIHPDPPRVKCVYCVVKIFS